MEVLGEVGVGLGPAFAKATARKEVVGFAGDRLFLMPTGIPHGLAPNARVIPIGGAGDVAVGAGLLGRVIDGAGQPLDDRGPLRLAGRWPLYGTPMNPLQRTPIREQLDVGVRSINALLGVGRGQRLGLFAHRLTGGSRFRRGIPR